LFVYGREIRSREKRHRQHFWAEDKLRFAEVKGTVKRNERNSNNIQIRDDDPLMVDHKKISENIVGGNEKRTHAGDGLAERKSLTRGLGWDTWMEVY
jgi:hypothetical protein